MYFRTLCVVQSLPLVFVPSREFGADTGKDPAFLVCASLSAVLKLGENALVRFEVITKSRSLDCAAVETVEYASRTVEDGGLKGV